MIEIYTKRSIEKPLTMNNEDLRRCAQFSIEAWPINKLLVADQEYVKFMMLNVEIALLMSNWYAIIRKNGKIKGLVFGRVESEITNRFNLFSGLNLVKIFFKILQNKYGKIRSKFDLFFTMVRTQLVVAKKMAGSEATVMLFVVDGSMRGLGLGRKLIDYFRSYAGGKGAKRISLYTDIESNWRFYERTGFKRVADFRDAFLSHYKHQDVCSFVYEIATLKDSNPN